MATYLMPAVPPKNFVLLTTIYAFMSWSIRTFIRCKLQGIGYEFIFGTTLVFNNVDKAVYQDFLPDALRRGTYVCAPPALVVEGKGLEYVQEGMELLKKGVSARKVGVYLE